MSRQHREQILRDYNRHEDADQELLREQYSRRLEARQPREQGIENELLSSRELTPRAFTSVHETGHAFFWNYAGVPVRRIELHEEPLMGDGEWSGEVEPESESMAGTDRTWAIMAAYAGPLAEVKLRGEESSRTRLRFDYSNDETDFTNGAFSDKETGTTLISLISNPGVTPIKQPLLTASFHSDVVGSQEHPGARILAGDVDRLDVLAPLCMLVRRLLDLPAVWNTILRFSIELEMRKQIVSPDVDQLFGLLFEEETSIAANDLWKKRNEPLWDDERDWFLAQGRAFVRSQLDELVGTQY